MQAGWDASGIHGTLYDTSRSNFLVVQVILWEAGRRQSQVVTIQHASSDDLELLSELYEELSGEKPDFIKMKENFNLMKSSPNYVVLTAKEDNVVVGSVMGIICLDLVKRCQPFMVIENVVVKSTWRGRGIGAKLMQEIEEIGRNRNCYFTMFVSAGHRKEAHKFYEAIGYNVDLVQGFKKYL